MRSAFTLIVLLGLLILAGAIGFWTWQEVGEVEIGMHGWIAIGLGAAVTFLLGAGLMALMFLSSRRGYDERAPSPSGSSASAGSRLRRTRSEFRQRVGNSSLATRGRIACRRASCSRSGA